MIDDNYFFFPIICTLRNDLNCMVETFLIYIEKKNLM